MKRKICCLVLVVAMLVGTVSGCGNGSKSVDDIATIYSLLSTQKYMREQEVDLPSKSELSFAGIKNEIQSAQLMFTAHENVTNFNLTANDLTNGSAVIGKDKVKIYAERYLEIYYPYNQAGGETYFSEAGFYPDAIVPIEKYKLRSEDNVKKGNNQALWIDIDIPLDAAPGNYSSSFVLTINGIEKSIPVSLKVYDLVLPDEVHNPTAFDIWYQNIAFGEGDNMDANTYETYYEYLWTKRLTCETLPPQYAGSMDKWLEYVEKIAENPKVTSIRIPLAPMVSITQEEIYPVKSTPVPEKVKEAKDKIVEQLVDQLSTIVERNLKLRNEGNAKIDLMKKALYYYEDEPSGVQRINSVRIFSELLNTAQRAVASKYKVQLNNHKDLEKSLLNIDQIMTTTQVNETLFVSNNPDGTPNRDKSDGVSFWVPEMYQFNSKGFRDIIKQRQALDEKVWWYLCVSNSPRPSYYAESLPINIRLQNWMQYDYNVGGILYWAVANYQPDRDTYEDIQRPSSPGSTQWYGGGEGILMYPGARYGQKQPISSWRLEQIRLGQQDYELFYMLNEYLTDTKSTVDAQKIVEKLGKVLYSGTSIYETAKESDLETARISILEILACFKANDTAGATTLIDKLMK